MDDEIKKAAMVERMNKARTTRLANIAAKKAAEAIVETAAPEVTRQVKKAPIVAEEPAQPAPSRTRSDGRLEVRGRNDEMLSRTRTQVGDIFDIPKGMIPDLWEYQWNAVSVAGNSEVLLDTNHMMFQNGWRPVPAERYAGTLVPRGSKGNIIRGQQMLMERPKALCDEARAEDIRNAQQLISDRNEALKLGGVKKNLGQGFEMSEQYKGTGGGVKIQIDRSLDVLNVNQQAGKYTLDE